MTKNLVYYRHTKHITIKYHLIEKTMKDDKIQLKYCRNEDQVAYIFTTAISGDKF